jgi:guanine deaminase
VLAESANKVAQTNDPTAHAEILAIREACMKLGTEHLVDATIYVMAHPCPMCQGSPYYCSPREVVFLITRESYEQYYLDGRKYFESQRFTTNSRRAGTSGGCPCDTSPKTPRWRFADCGMNATAANANRRSLRRTETAA